VAHWLRDRGYDAYAVRGGLAALLGQAPLDLVEAPEGEPLVYLFFEGAHA